MLEAINCKELRMTTLRTPAVAAGRDPMNAGNYPGGAASELVPAQAQIEAWWHGVLRRDPGLDGQFVFAVTTTGVYCRPSCASRHPLRRNVRFFASPADAEQAGFRPCKRCRPQSERDETKAAMQVVLHYIEAHLDGD